MQSAPKIYVVPLVLGRQAVHAYTALHHLPAYHHAEGHRVQKILALIWSSPRASAIFREFHVDRHFRARVLRLTACLSALCGWHVRAGVWHKRSEGEHQAALQRARRQGEHARSRRNVRSVIHFGAGTVSSSANVACYSNLLQQKSFLVLRRVRSGSPSNPITKCLFARQ